jgi:MFS family permease
MPGSLVLPDNNVIFPLMKNRETVIPFHYGWVIVITGMLCVLACLGFGRFAIGMLLPSMGSTLNLSYSQMGFISTGNFIGYLAAVLVSGFWAARIGARKLIFIALLVVGISMALISLAKSFACILVLYMVTGAGSGASNVPVMGLVSSWFSSRKRGKAAGFIVIGSGFAIIISGRLIPFINGLIGPEGWRVSWLVLGGTVTIISLLAFVLLRDSPTEKGLRPVGSDEAPDSHPHDAEGVRINIYRKGVLYYLGAIYFIFGYTYVIYATFIVTTLVKERGFSESSAGNLWAWVGFLSLFSGPVFGTLSDRLGRKTGLMVVFSLQTIAYLLVASGLPGILLYMSIVCYGIVAWSIPTIMAAAVGDYVGARRAAVAFGLITFIFGLGQIIGPAIAGVLAEKAGSFAGSFYMAAAFAAAAIVLAAFLRKPETS